MASVSGCTVEQYCRRDRNGATEFAHFLPENGALSYGDNAVLFDHLEVIVDILDHEYSGDLYDYLGSLGAMKLTEARLDWFCDVRKRLYSR